MLFKLNGKKRNIYYLPDRYLEWIVRLSKSHKLVNIAKEILIKRCDEANKSMCKHSHTVRNPIGCYHQCQDCYAVRWDKETKWYPAET